MTSMDTIPAIVGAFSRYNNYLANVLGTAGYHTVYQCIPASASQQYCSTDNGSGAGNVHIWDIGFSHVAQIDYNNSPPEPNDTLTASSFYRYGNYDVVHGSVQFNSSEVPTSDPTSQIRFLQAIRFRLRFTTGSRQIFLIVELDCHSGRTQPQERVRLIHRSART